MSGHSRGEVLTAGRVTGVPHLHVNDNSQEAFDANFGTNVSRLKNVFQADHDDNMPVKSNKFANYRSPEIKRKRSTDTEMSHTQVAHVAQCAPDTNTGQGPIDPTAMDPQKLFETTNHVQRFQFTRAIFARMEEQNKMEQERQKNIHRRISPNRQLASPTSPTPHSGPNKPFERRTNSPAPPEPITKHRSSSDPPTMERVQAKKHEATNNETAAKRAESMDNLDNQAYGKRPRPQNLGSELAKNHNKMRDTKPAKIEQQVDIKETNGQEESKETAPSTRWLKQQFENKGEKKQDHKPQTVSKVNRFPRNDRNENKENDGVPPALPPRNYKVGSPDERPAFNHDHQTQPQQIPKEEGRPAIPSRTSGYQRETTSSIPQSKGSRFQDEPQSRGSRFPDDPQSRGSRFQDDPQSRGSKFQEDNIPWRHRYGRSDKNESSSGALLPKRRSREDRLSKEDIEASLSEADKYWNRSYKAGEGPESPESKMTESTYSSGSGEEMATSDNKQELIHSPTSPPESPVKNAPRRPWTNRNKPPRGSGDFDETINSQKLESQFRYSREAEVQKSHEDASVKSGYPGVLNLEGPIPGEPEEVAQVTLDQADAEDEEFEKLWQTSSGILDKTPSPGAPEALFLEDDDTEETLSPGPPTTSPPPPPAVKLNIDSDHINMQEEFFGDTDTDIHMTVEREGSPDSRLLGANLGVRKIPSPNESVESMTPSEQDAFLSKTDSHILSHATPSAKDFLDKREQGDGHEEPEGILPDLTTDDVDDNVQVLEDGNFFYEVTGIPELTQDEIDQFPGAKKPNKVQFSIDPIKVFSTYSVEEYDRKNEDVDPMAASAEYELEKRVERMEVFPVELDKGPDGLGLRLPCR